MFACVQFLHVKKNHLSPLQKSSAIVKALTSNVAMTVAKGFMVQVSVLDRMEMVDRRVTADGFLATKARIARTGIYKYTRKELNLDGNPNDLISIFRPEETVSIGRAS